MKHKIYMKVTYIMSTAEKEFSKFVHKDTVTFKDFESLNTIFQQKFRLSIY